MSVSLFLFLSWFVCVSVYLTVSMSVGEYNENSVKYLLQILCSYTVLFLNNICVCCIWGQKMQLTGSLPVYSSKVHISICICQYTALGLSFVFIVTSRSFCVHCCHAGTRVPVHEVSLQDVVLLTWHYKAIMVLLFLCPHHCGQRWLTCKHACGYRLKYFIVSVALLPSCRSFNSLAPFWHETWIQTSQPRRFLQSLVLATVLASTQAVSYQWFIVCASTCSWRVTTYVGKPSAVGQPIRPTQPFILSG